MSGEPQAGGGGGASLPVAVSVRWGGAPSVDLKAFELDTEALGEGGQGGAVTVADLKRCLEARTLIPAVRRGAAGEKERLLPARCAAFCAGRGSSANPYTPSLCLRIASHVS